MSLTTMGVFISRGDITVAVMTVPSFLGTRSFCLVLQTHHITRPKTHSWDRPPQVHDTVPGFSITIGRRRQAQIARDTRRPMTAQNDDYSRRVGYTGKRAVACSECNVFWCRGADLRASDIANGRR
ncbi:hypothetical protein C8Q73DRAFT_706227 [Cubamyces lactineus]|nr:hypothetical protein C8Q73DRAFT_706227 [Cubamyces lactineus]